MNDECGELMKQPDLVEFMGLHGGEAMGQFTLEAMRAKSLRWATYTNTVALVLLCLLTLTACSDPKEARKQQLLSELHQVDNDYTRQSQTVSNRKNTVGYLEQQLLTHRSNLSDYKSRVEAYAMNHKMALTAITLGLGGTAVALDSTSTFSSDEKTVGGLLAAGAALWALNNTEELSEVADTMNQVNSHIKSLERQISTLSSQLASESQHLSQEEQALRTLQVNGEEIRAKLRALGCGKECRT